MTEVQGSVLNAVNALISAVARKFRAWGKIKKYRLQTLIIIKIIILIVCLNGKNITFYYHICKNYNSKTLSRQAWAGVSLRVVGEVGYITPTMGSTRA